MSQASHVPTREQRAQVSGLVCTGATQQTIAAIIGINHETLRKYYDVELRFGQMMANANVVGTLYKKATGNGDWQKADTTAIIWWTKTQPGLKWREAPREISGPKGGPIQLLELSKLSDEQLRTLDHLLIAASGNGSEGDPGGGAGGTETP